MGNNTPICGWRFQTTKEISIYGVPEETIFKFPFVFQSANLGCIDNNKL